MGGKLVVWVVGIVMVFGGSLVLNSETVHAMHYIALGDSFTSGEGETSDSFYQFKDTAPALLCHNSSRSYPYVAAQQLALEYSDIHNVACSGARVRDVVGGDEYYGQADRLLDGIDKTDGDKVSKLQLAALGSFAPGITRQMMFVDRYRPELATIGVGGNDVGMVDKLKACMMTDTCHWASDRSIDSRTKAGREIQSLYDVLVPTYGYLASRSPLTHFYVVGYPKIINPAIPCDLSLGIMFDTSERIFMNEAILYLNTVIKAAAQSAGIAFIAEQEAFKGNALCDPTNTPAMNTVRPGDDIAPLPGATHLKLFGNESFHPTPYGHFLLAKSIVDVIGQDIATDFSQYPHTQENSRAPELPSYWRDDGRILPRQMHSPDMTAGPDIDGRLILTLPAGSFASNTDAKVLIHSDEIELQTARTTEEGGLTATLEIPDVLESGFHTVIVQGVDVEGVGVEYYTTIYHEHKDVPVSVDVPHPGPRLPGITAIATNTITKTGQGVLGAYADERQTPFMLTSKPDRSQFNFLLFAVAIVLVGTLGILYKLRKWT